MTEPDRTQTLRDVTRLHGSICGACHGLTNLFETGRLPPFGGVPGMGDPVRDIEDLIGRTKRNGTKRNTKEKK